MPFYNPPRAPLIKEPNGHPIDVIATTNLFGKIRIDYIQFTDDRQERFTFKISNSLLRKDLNYIETYDCNYVSNGIMHTITLIFNVLSQLWVLA
ncbi:MAG: hypothetical protein K0R00_920 [Herbinix sp.]|jgi:hypothetical protein|nr:hypothetical protein [Herbinix sp.]